MGDMADSEEIRVDDFDPRRIMPVSLYTKEQLANFEITLLCFSDAILQLLHAKYDGTKQHLLVHALRFYHHCVKHSYIIKRKKKGGVVQTRQQDILFFEDRAGQIRPLQESAVLVML